jgi:hypothetical protein
MFAADSALTLFTNSPLSLYLDTDGVNLFGGQILSKIGSSDDDNVSDNEAIRHIATRQVIALSMGIPACLCAILALRLVGTKRLQVSFEAAMSCALLKQVV